MPHTQRPNDATECRIRCEQHPAQHVARPILVSLVRRVHILPTKAESAARSALGRISWWGSLGEIIGMGGIARWRLAVRTGGDTG